jgi:hypothetical protein
MNCEVRTAVGMEALLEPEVAPVTGARWMATADSPAVRTARLQLLMSFYLILTTYILKKQTTKYYSHV